LKEPIRTMAELFIFASYILVETQIHVRRGALKQTKQTNIGFENT